MDIKTLQQMSKSRADRWHKGDMNGWNPLEWAGAMAGEAGEACNWAKKWKRLDDDIASINDVGRHSRVQAEILENVAGEAADTILYGICLLSRCGIDAEECIRRIFNKKSEEYGFPEKI